MSRTWERIAGGIWLACQVAAVGLPYVAAWISDSVSTLTQVALILPIKFSPAESV
ncbi:MAG TPA: hypothetical protein VGD99_06135 [Anaerolineae bacterium]|jgi:hypothetical protein